MAEYFSRTINEGTVKRTHICSFDSNIVLTMLVTRSKKVIDSIVKAKSGLKENESEIVAKESFMDQLSSLRINGLPIIYEDLDKCFDSEEIAEVIHFLNDGDMSIFGGEAKSETEKNV